MPRSRSGLMHVIINENLFDADYVARYTVGFEELKARAQQYPPEKVAHWTGISADDIRKLAREYATVRPSVIRVNYGIQRSERGGMAMRAVTMLPCLIGSWKEVGGGLQLSLSGSFGLNKAALEDAGADAEGAGTSGPHRQHGATWDSAEFARLGRRSRRCLSTTRIRRRFVPTTTRSFAD